MSLLLILTLIFNFQSSLITIKVLDEDTGKPIPFVNFTRISDHKGSFGNEEGIIIIESEPNQAFQLSCVGYQSLIIVPSESSDIVYLKPIVKELKEVVVTGRKNKEKTTEIGYLSKTSFNPYYTGLTRKMALSTYIPNKNKGGNIIIKDILIDIGGRKSKIYDSFVIRLFIKENINSVPGKDLLQKDLVVKIKTNSYKHSFPLQETLILPENGCFVGFETVGKIDKDNNFIPFTDFYQKPEKSFEFVIRKVKSGSFSLTRFGGTNAWFEERREDRRPDTYAMGLNVISLID